MTEFVGTIDNALLQKYEVKLYGSDRDTYNIINDFLEDNQSERAFYIIDLGEITTSYATWTRLLPDVKPYYAVNYVDGGQDLFVIISSIYDLYELGDFLPLTKWNEYLHAFKNIFEGIKLLNENILGFNS